MCSKFIRYYPLNMEGETTAVKGKTKLREFRRIEQLMQHQWLIQHIFESDAQTSKEYSFC